ncbi:LysR family transcriptional regulator, partial [Burkholderia sp. TJI49]
DVAIRLGEAAPSAEVVARPLGAFHRYVVASHDYLDARGTPATPGELVDHECLRFHFGGDQQAWAFADAHGTTRVLVTGRLKSNHSEVLREAVLDSAGIALLPDWLVDADVQSGRLRRLFEQYDVTPDTARSVVTALYLPNQRGSKRVAAFIDFVETLARAQH